MREYIENILLLGLLIVALTACSSTPKRELASAEQIRVQDEIVNFEVKVSNLAPKNTIIKKEVHWNAEGLEGQCYILEGGKVRKSFDGKSITETISKKIKLDRSVAVYDENILRSFVNEAAEGKAMSVSDSTLEESEGPMVLYGGFIETSSGVKKAKIIKLKSHDSAVYVNNKLKSHDVDSMLEVVDAICK